MDQNFNRQSQPRGPQTQQTPPVPPASTVPASSTSSSRSGLHKIATIVIGILVFVALGAALTAILLTTNKADKTQQTSTEKRIAAIEDAEKYTEKEVDKSRYQAVFLASGQVYFGKITEINKDTFKLEDIYYLKTGSVDKAGNPTAGADVSLVKLGKELHAPDDVM